MSKTALILANGKSPTRSLLLRYRKRSEFFVCADGGANYAASLGESPDLIIGDLDSIKASTVKKFRSILTRRISDQNSTDLEKALSWLVRKNYTDIIVLGATGGRVDHLAGNLSALGKFSKRARITFADESGELRVVGSEMVLDAPAGTTISLIPLAKCEGIVTHGLKWELLNGTLELGVSEGTSNVVKSSPATIRVRRGTLLIFQLRQSAGSRGSS
ncbi:MAG TPA: thiamine diphosphokinase [Bacteroidota bacterium]|nr:thiamine diphosphokinase [Bacteroidota bacterium]